ncbi:hypothetical protein BDV38DRAFT_276786 [Aspergillus pseudotamarii]|uniref:Uncharacterized protein n=1 Tax=Aspergillus pseudotamarii TaxID=132259 RepID=A0A5N6TBJ8_ASPPS|nr:uncharacterized protein BDV38DRAFT_276786 [Aspergillus pseudotamarii]KAE8143703.1 hypothetical protein BDV38DRAFT_276786 [Aspergillus pseudotamarii]
MLYLFANVNFKPGQYNNWQAAYDKRESLYTTQFDFPVMIQFLTDACRPCPPTSTCSTTKPSEAAWTSPATADSAASCTTH